MFVYHTRFATSESNVTDSNLPEPSAENDRAASFARAPDAAAHTTSSSLAGPSESRTKSEPEDSEGANASASSLTPTSTDSVAKGKNNAPSGYDQVTLAGTFVDTASYAVATGSAGYVGDELANADMTKLQKEPNNKLAQDKQGKIWIGDGSYCFFSKSST
ncbi:uncharacterized protein JCM15063_002131 [Sporobolomyces koalae]|uniref:uncharacterized protein n=1 Tax=Sporobolomyces koalae TaxID=500713 RepID=UPI00317C4AFA